MNSDPSEVLALLAEARSLRDQGDLDAALTAIDKALALQPKNIAALMMKADHLHAAGDARAAAAFYAIVARAPASASAEDVSRARDALERLRVGLEDHIRAQLKTKGLSGSAVPPRFRRALDIMVGGKQAYQQTPRYFFYPELAPVQFFERSDFPFLDEVEAAWTNIRAELAAIDASPAEFEPYLKTDPRRPQIRNVAIANKLDWGAYFMVRDGVETPEARATPKTLAALSRAPLARIAGRSPSVLFSRLLPGAHIPVHTGMINARLICHLAVVAPPNCWLRVGNERREWQEGKAWVFDDTIEHEAFNGSDRVRTVLLFDIWRPELDEAERAGIVAICEAIDGFSERREWD